jgi:hypothetical protein
MEIVASIISLGYHIREPLKNRSLIIKGLLYDNLLIPGINNPLQHGFKHKHEWVKKATGLGISEFFLRLMVWFCLMILTIIHKCV